MARKVNEPEQSGSSAGRKIGMGCGVIVLALILGISYKGMVGNANPTFTIPPKIAPSPNAFDTYRNAAQMLVNANQIDDALDPQKGYTLAQQEQLVASNAQALQTLRSGFSQDYLDTGPRSMTEEYPHLAQFRSLARLLRLEAVVKMQKGDWSGALDSDLDCMYMGEEIPHGAPLLGQLTGIACQASGRKQLWKYIDHLDAAQSRKSIARLQDILNHHFPVANTLLEEKYSGMHSLKDIFHGNYNSPGINGNSDPPQQIQFALFFMIYGKDRIAHNYVTYMDQTIANSRIPYAAHAPDPPIPNDPITSLFCPIYSQERIKDVENQTQNGMLLVTLALHAYQVENGHYPSSLEAMIPSYLKQLPLDPFALNDTFQYRLNDAEYLLYSLGPDGKDDSGKVIDDPSKATSTNQDARYYVYADSKGDIVAGKNFSPF